MRLCAVLALAACGTDHRSVTLSTSFVVDMAMGSNASPLDPLAGQTFAIDVTFDPFFTSHGDGSAPAGCREFELAYDAPLRVARGPTASLVQTQILDMLPAWEAHLQLCDNAVPTFYVSSVIDPLNLAFGCFGVPPGAMRTDASGYPILTSFTATKCSATILDVVNNRVFGNSDFSIQVSATPDPIGCCDIHNF